MAGAQSVSGLASGLDTASIISGLMVVEKQPQVRVQQKIVVEQARQQALRDVLGQLNSLTTAYQGLTDIGTWADTQAIASSDDAHVSATRTGGAAPGAYTIDVTQLARANQFTSAGTGAVVADDTLHIATASGTTDVAVKAGDTLDVVAGKINGTTGSPVYATLLERQARALRQVVGHGREDRVRHDRRRLGPLLLRDADGARRLLQDRRRRPHERLERRHRRARRA